jgi:hypothetical protein
MLSFMFNYFSSFEEEQQLGANEEEEAENCEEEDPDQPGPSSKKPKLF